MNLRVDRCCCMSLRTGGLFWGWLGLVSAIVNSITKTLALIEYYAKMKEFHTLTKDQQFQILKTADPNTAYATIVLCLIDAVLNGIMIYGITQNKRKMLLPWLAFKGVAMVVATASCLFLIGYALITGNIALVFITLLFVLLLGLGGWIWVAIYSLYHEIYESTKPSMTIDRNSAVGTVSAPPYQEYYNKSHGPAYPDLNRV